MSPTSPVRDLSSLGEGDLRGRTALVRVDYNVPLSPEGGVQDDGRIRATLPTLRALRAAGSRIVLTSHLGRPEGVPDPTLSLAPVARRLSEILGVPVPLVTDPPGARSLAARIERMADGEVVLLENVRFHPGETTNDGALARALGELAELFVGDAFGAAHRAHASTEGAARVIRERGGRVVAGLLMARELRFLGMALTDPVRPFVALLGGAKISGKIELIEAILPRVDHLLIGGAMANTFLRALGLELGDSLVEEDRVAVAGALLDQAGDRILLPVDVVVASEILPEAETRTVDRTAVGTGDRIADIGPRTRSIFGREIAGASTLLWNGPMGVFELAPFAAGTLAVAHAVAGATDRGATTIVGGGDSAAAAQAAGVIDRMTHVSTGGGASLDFLAGRPLPGVEVLDRWDGPEAFSGGDSRERE